MTRMAPLTRAVHVVVMLAGGAAAPLVAPAGPAMAGPGTSWGTGISLQIPPLANSSWAYGSSLNYQVDPRLTGGLQVIAASSTPQICKVARDVRGTPTGALQLIDVGECKVSFHLDGDATHAPYDSVVTHAVAPRALSLSCRDVQRASDEPSPALTPVFSNLAPWDAPGDFSVRPGPISESLAPGRWPVSLLTASTVNPGTGRPRYDIHSEACTLTVNPVLKVTGVPARKAANLVVDGKPVEGNRLVFPYGSKATYSVAPVLGGTARSHPGLGLHWPEAWFASASTGTITGDTTVSYLTFGDLVSASPFPDFTSSSSWTTRSSDGWRAARRYLTSGYDGVPEADAPEPVAVRVKQSPGVHQEHLIHVPGTPGVRALQGSRRQAGSRTSS